ncbi:MAG: hypothetical protein PVJ28_11835 [Acidimicrobiia bacterium]|jgi:heme/copper-type cytochrome/quinol oxidase subunit 4
MAEHSEQADSTRDARMGKAILKGLAIGFPASLVILTVAIWLITDLDLGDSFATALLPGILFGGFAGGFAGVAATMD